MPFTPLLLADLLKESGLPDGVFNLVQGDRETVEAVLDHPGITAAAFVGSTAVAKAVYDRGVAANKRMLTLGTSKNALQNSLSTHFMLATLAVLSITRPST